MKPANDEQWRTNSVAFYNSSMRTQIHLLLDSTFGNEY